MALISEILKKYDTDKEKDHSYGYVYDHIFNRFDRNAPLNILEIGTQKGGSLLAWKEYFPNSKVTGIDIVDQVTEYRSEFVNYVIQDVNDYRTDELFDIVIDDGSHWLKDVVHTVSYFTPKLKPGGCIIIEDVQNPKVWQETIHEIVSPFWAYNQGREYTLEYVDNTQVSRADDFLIVITNDLRDSK